MIFQPPTLLSFPTDAVEKLLLTLETRDRLALLSTCTSLRGLERRLPGVWGRLDAQLRGPDRAAQFRRWLAPRADSVGWLSLTLAPPPGYNADAAHSSGTAYEAQPGPKIVGELAKLLALLAEGCHIRLVWEFAEEPLELCHAPPRGMLARHLGDGGDPPPPLLRLSSLHLSCQETVELGPLLTNATCLTSLTLAGPAQHACQSPFPPARTGTRLHLTNLPPRLRRLAVARPGWCALGPPQTLSPGSLETGLEELVLWQEQDGSLSTLELKNLHVLSSLTSLSLRGHQLWEVPAEVQALTRLQCLELDMCPLPAAPPLPAANQRLSRLRGLQQLRSLRLAGCLLRWVVVSGVLALPRLEALGLLCVSPTERASRVGPIAPSLRHLRMDAPTAALQPEIIQGASALERLGLFLYPGYPELGQGTGAGCLQSRARLEGLLRAVASLQGLRELDAAQVLQHVGQTLALEGMAPAGGGGGAGLPLGSGEQLLQRVTGRAGLLVRQFEGWPFDKSPLEAGSVG